MATLTLDTIRDCLDGEIPASLATCGLDGVPNCSFVSQVHYVDGEHVGLSFQFFNKTRENILANPVACCMVTHPTNGASYRIDVRYLRTELEGPVFESMKAKLAGLATQCGMADVFKLQGADIYAVTRVSGIAGKGALPIPPKRNLLPAVRSFASVVDRCSDLDVLLDHALVEVERTFAVKHAMIHWLDERAERLFLVASRGYAHSGVGSEVQVGQGVIGNAAGARTSIRVTHATADYTYLRAVRESVRETELSDKLEAELPSIGLATPGSQLAVPIMARGRQFGVLYVEDERPARFGYDEEDALGAVGHQLGLAAWLLERTDERRAAPVAEVRGEVARKGECLGVRHYAADDTIFIGDAYLIKGVAGAILWKLLREREQGRTEFTNRELRLDPALQLPDLSSNLEARLILLQRRLAERCPHIAMEKTGRGRFRIHVTCELKLVESA